MRAWLFIHQCDPTRQFGPWVKTIAANTCKNSLKAKTLQIQREELVSPLPTQVAEGYEESFLLLEPDPAEGGFVVLPKRWIVEWTFAWCGRSRRLSKDFEALCETVETWILLAMIHLMTKRLTKH